MPTDTQTPNADTTTATTLSPQALGRDCDSLTIRLVHPEDAAQLDTLVRQSFGISTHFEIEQSPGQGRHLWIAELDGKALTAIAMKEDGLTARIQSVHADPTCRSLPAELLSAALAFCRKRGLLKVEVAEDLELETTPELLERCGFLYSRSRNGRGRRFVDLYTNIYQRDSARCGGNSEAGA